MSCESGFCLDVLGEEDGEARPSGVGRFGSGVQ